MLSNFASAKTNMAGPCGPCGAKANMGACVKKSKWAKSYDIVYINKLPFNIERSGKYVVEAGLLKYNAKKDPCGKVAITIAKKGKFKGGVYLDLSGAVIDMRKGAGTSILIDGVEDVTIVNGNFRNSGDPGEVPISGAIPDTGVEGLVPLDATTAQPSQQLVLNQIIAQYPATFVLVNAVDPYSGVGIAIHASEGIVVKNCKFDHMFIGIAGICTSSDPKNLDISRNIVVKNCDGSGCGFKKPNVSYYPEIDTMPNVFRGAFIAFQSQNFLGPTQATPFFCGSINIVTGEMDNTAQFPKCFQGITIDKCNASSQVAQAGIFLTYTNSVVINDCVMQLPANYKIPIPVEEIVNDDAYLLNVFSPYLGYFNHAVHITNCSGQGGYNTFNFAFDMNLMMDHSTAQYHYCDGMLIWYEQYPVISNCKVSEGLDLGLPISYTGGIPFPLFGVGYAIQFLVNYMGLVENTSQSNYRTTSPIQTSTDYYSQYNNYQDAVGFTYGFSSYCHLRNNNVFNNGAGMGAADVCDHMTIEGNIVWANGVDFEPGTVGGYFIPSAGLDNSFTNTMPGDPLRFNKYINNRFMNNGQYGNTNVWGGTPGTPYYVVGCPYLVTAPFLPPGAPIPINANIQETPSIALWSNYNPGPSGLVAGLNALSSFLVQTFFQGDTFVWYANVWQGAASTVPILGYKLHTPSRGELAPDATPVVPGAMSFSLANINTSDMGAYFVTVEFDIGTLPPPALSFYRSNVMTIEKVVPLPPTWSASVNYALNAFVQYEGVVYQSLVVNNLGNIPSPTSTYWTAIGST